jgi:hypothetical protein
LRILVRILSSAPSRVKRARTASDGCLDAQASASTSRSKLLVADLELFSSAIFSSNSAAFTSCTACSRCAARRRLKSIFFMSQLHSLRHERAQSALKPHIDLPFDQRSGTSNSLRFTSSATSLSLASCSALCFFSASIPRECVCALRRGLEFSQFWRIRRSVRARLFCLIACTLTTYS